MGMGKDGGFSTFSKLYIEHKMLAIVKPVPTYYACPHVKNANVLNKRVFGILGF